MNAKRTPALGEYLRQCLSGASMSQKQLAEAIGCAPAQVSNWATGRERPSAHRLRQLAGKLGGFRYKSAVYMLIFDLGSDIGQQYEVLS